MIRAMAVLTAAVCLAAPVLAQDSNARDRDRDMNRSRDMDRNRSGERNPNRGVMGGLSPYPVYERRLPRRFWRERYRLTPGEYHRLRSEGFSQQEVFMIANAARHSGLD